MPSPLYPAFPVATPVNTQSPPASVIWRQGPLWDWETGDYLRDPTGAIVMADAWTTWRQWCEKALLTQQHAYIIYSRAHGVDHARILPQTPRSLVQAEYAAAFTAALVRHPATKSVSNFGFTWVGRVLWPSCTAQPVSGAPARLDLLALLGPNAVPGGI